MQFLGVVIIAALLLAGCATEVTSHTDAVAGQSESQTRVLWFVGQGDPPPAPTPTPVVGAVGCMSPLPNLSQTMGVDLSRTSERGALEFGGYTSGVFVPPGWVGALDSTQGLVIVDGPGVHNAYSGRIYCKAQYPAGDSVYNLCQLLSREEARLSRNGYVVIGNVRQDCS